MVNRKYFVILLISVSLISIAGFALTTGVATDTGFNTPDTQDQIKPLSSNAEPEGTIDLGEQVLAESQATGSTFSGEIVTCSNLQVIDLRLGNLVMEKQSITVYPMGTTIELLTKPYIVSKYIPIPYGISSIDLVSSNGEELTLGVPPCIYGSGETGGNSRSSGFSSSNDQTEHPPEPVPEVSTMALTGIGVFGLIFIISRNRQ